MFPGSLRRRMREVMMKIMTLWILMMTLVCLRRKLPAQTSLRWMKTKFCSMSTLRMRESLKLIRKMERTNKLIWKKNLGLDYIQCSSTSTLYASITQSYFSLLKKDFLRFWVTKFSPCFFKSLEYLKMRIWELAITRWVLSVGSTISIFILWALTLYSTQASLQSKPFQ